MTETAVELAENERQRIVAAWQGVTGAIGDMGEAIAEALQPVVTEFNKLLASEPFQRIALAGRLDRLGRIGSWLACYLPLRVVRWLNRL